MTQTEAEDVKHLAKPCNKALGVITERECSHCKGSGLSVNCPKCNGTGKVGGWKWKPEVNQTVLYDKKLMFIVSVGRTWLSLLPFDIPDFGEPLDDYVCTPEIIDVIPILECEEIERVLEGAGYYFSRGEEVEQAEDMLYIQKQGLDNLTLKVEIDFRDKDQQPAVMEAVIALSKRLGEELRHV